MKKLLLPLAIFAIAALPASASAEQCRNGNGQFAKCGTPGAVLASQYKSKGDKKGAAPAMKPMPAMMAPKPAAMKPAAIPAMKPAAVPAMKPAAVPAMKPAAVPAMKPAAVPAMKPAAKGPCKNDKGKFIKCM